MKLNVNSPFFAIKGILATLFLMLLCSILMSAQEIPLWASGAFPIGNTWVQTTLVDLYVGLTLFSIWVFYRERYTGIAVAWIVSFVLLGNLTTTLYALIAFLPVNGKKDLPRFFMGHRAKEK